LKLPNALIFANSFYRNQQYLLLMFSLQNTHVWFFETCLANAVDFVNPI
jgi:hypothetical protein